jgi:V/A-type H+-transporting ATPase subunit F
VSIHVLGDEDTVLGFRLAGIRGTVAGPGEGLAEQFRSLVTGEQTKVVLITERLAAGIRPLVDTYRMRSTFPVVVEIPDAGGPIPGRRSIADLIREAIGFRV